MKRLIIALALLMPATALAADNSDTDLFTANDVLGSPKAKIISSNYSEGANAIFTSVVLAERSYLCVQGLASGKFNAYCISKK